MELAISNAAALKPEIKLAQALSEFEAVLGDSQKASLRTYKGQRPPDVQDVMRLTAEIDKESARRKSRQCVGPRLTNILQSVQQFTTVVDLCIGGSQNLLASAIWGTVKMSLLV